MIKFSDKHTEILVRHMWKICFEDTDAFIDLFFSQKYRHENTLVYFEQGEAVASLQMLPYTITFCGREIPFAYLAGLCTLPEHRKKGYMAHLIYEAHRVLKEREIPLAILVPAEDWLFGFYERFDYERVFDKSEEPIYSLDKLLKETSDIEAAYSFFDSLYRNKDFCVQKTFEDFKTIVEEYRNDGSPDKYNLAGMARVIDEEYLLSLFADKHQDKEMLLKIGECTYSMSDGIAKQTQGSSDISVDLRMLCRSLFGYRTSELDEPLRSIFPEHHPVMNLMLE